MWGDTRMCLSSLCIYLLCSIVQLSIHQHIYWAPTTCWAQCWLWGWSNETDILNTFAQGIDIIVATTETSGHISELILSHHVRGNDNGKLSSAKGSCGVHIEEVWGWRSRESLISGDFKDEKRWLSLFPLVPYYLSLWGVKFMMMQNHWVLRELGKEPE